VNPLEFVPCPKICMAATPRMVNASFTDTGDKIQVCVLKGGGMIGTCEQATGSLQSRVAAAAPLVHVLALPW
jgi:hypothetical protein